jgi:pimeloyl-ACP methyl ester carboxylesterase
MRLIQRALVDRGYRVVNLGYPSRAADIATLATNVGRQIATLDGEEPIDFVTHSLGGILLRAAVAARVLSPQRIRRVVMLGPPNGGSELADILPGIPVFGWLYRQITGPAGLELGTAANGVIGRLPPVSFDLGVIAGNRSFNPFFSAILGDANDGKVRVERTRVEGMKDFLVVPYWHPLMMFSPKVVAQVLHYLEAGAFER